ncbi:MAG: alanyl-tRNA editing protein [Sarcina sp.]
MEKLYYENQYIKEFIAEIEETKEENGRFHIVLNKTAFFPGGGGQASDRGKIDNQNIIDVYEKNGIIYHVIEKKPTRIHRVKCEIDWNRRFDGMQQHFAQHVLSGCFYTLFNANTVSIHLGEKISTVDIEGIITEDQIRKVERFANEKIAEAIQVEFLTPNKKELKKLKIRREMPNTDEQIRILKIGDLDINACCGIHPNSTIELRHIKIKKFEKNKGNTRIEYLAGTRAINDALDKDDFARKICRYLSSSEKEAINSIKNLHDKLSEVITAKNKIEQEIARYEMKEMLENAENISGISVVKKVYETSDVKYVNKIATKLVEENNIVALFSIKNEKKINLIFAASKNIKGINMGSILKDSITLIDGKGGGSTFLAQGAGKDNGNLENALEYAKNKLK